MGLICLADFNNSTFNRISGQLLYSHVSCEFDNIDGRISLFSLHYGWSKPSHPYASLLEMFTGHLFPIKNNVQCNFKNKSLVQT